jgi:hypothetical protein
MKPGLGLYRHMLTEDNLSFARQAGATHIVPHLVEYFRIFSRANAREFCQGTVSEMPDVDVYEAMARFASQDRCVRVWDPGELGFLS